MAVALKLADRAGSEAARLGGKDAARRHAHVRDLLAYARSVANGIVPGQIWQLSMLGFGISPCNGGP